MTPDAVRQKRRRERDRSRVRCRLVEINEIDTPLALVRAGYLDRQSMDDPREQSAALSVFIAHWTKKSRHA